MWYRDYTLVQQRVNDLHREAREASTAALLRREQQGSGSNPGALRAVSAAGMRHLGLAAIRLSRRIDPTHAGPTPGSVQRVA